MVEFGGYRFTLGAIALAALALTACSGEGAYEELANYSEEGYEEVDSVQQGVRNGIVENSHRGLVMVNIFTPFGWGLCSGVLIAPRYLMTAAHCFQRDGQTTGLAVVQVTYPEPGSSTHVYDTKNLAFNIIPTYHGETPSVDTIDDIAIIQNDIDWPNTETNDYQRINGGTSSGSIFDIGQLELYGFGANAHDGSGVGVLRSMPVTPAGAQTHMFWDLAGSRQVCAGDSGGPTIGHLSTGEEIVAGIHSSTNYGGGSGVCADGGEQQRNARTNSRTAWIMSIVPGCSVYSHHMKCW